MTASAVWAVVLSWNGREDTLACLDTLTRQTRPLDHILVVDNGSQDGLEAPLRAAYPDAEYLFQPVNLGFAGGMNLGLRRALAAGAEYILASSNDTLLEKDCLRAMIAALESRPQAAAVAPKIFFHEPPGTIYFNGGCFTWATLRPCHPGELKPEPAPPSTAVREITFLNGCCPLFRAEALRRTGLYDETFGAYYEDADLSLRLRDQGWRLYLAPEAVVIHRHAASFRANAEPGQQGTVSPLKWYLMTRNRLWLLRKHGRWWQKALGFTLVAVSRSVLMILQVLRGRPKKAAGVLRGLWHGFLRGDFKTKPAA